MNTLTVDATRPSAPLWFWFAGALGASWNLYGLYQFAGTFTSAGQAAMTAGMTRGQAELYLSLPAWISVVFAIGVVGGLLGSIALLMRREAARPIFVASLIGYLLLFAGDLYHGVFAALPGQLAILTVVVIIAAALSWASRAAGRLGLLR